MNASDDTSADTTAARTAVGTSLRLGVIRSASWLGIAQIGQRFATLLVTALLARLLPPDDFGLIAMALIAVNLFGMFREVGVTLSLVQKPVISDDDLNTGFWLTCALGLGLYALGAVLATPTALLLHEPRLEPIILVLLITIPIHSLAQVPDALLQRRLAFSHIALIEAASALLSGIIGVVLAWTGFRIWALVSQQVVFAVMMTVGRYFGARWFPVMSVRRVLAVEYIRKGRWMAGGGLAAYAMRNVDNVIVGSVLGSTSLGFYALAYNLMLMPNYLVTGMVGRVIFPAFTSVMHDTPRAASGYLRAIKMLAMITFPLTVGLGMTAPLVIKVVYGPRWEPAVPILQVFVGVGILEALNIWGAIFFAFGRQNTMYLWFVISTAILAVSVSLGLHWGIQGVAWAYVLTAPIMLGVPHIIVKRWLRLRRQDLAHALVPALIGVVIMATAVHTVGAIISGTSLPTAARLGLLVFVGAGAYALAMIGLAVREAGCQGARAWLMGIT